MKITIAGLSFLAVAFFTQMAAQDMLALAPPQVTIQVMPTTVELLPGGKPVEVAVVVSNPGADPVGNVTLSSFTNASVAITITSHPERAEIPPYGEATWKLMLTSVDQGPISGRVSLKVDYTWQAEGQGNPANRVALASLEVKRRELTPITDVVDVEVKTPLIALNENQEATVYLVMTNKSDVPIHPKKITPEGPDFLSFRPPA